MRIFNHLLAAAGLLHDPRQATTAPKTGFAVMAFRKVNGMKRTFNASPGIFRKLADGKGQLPPQATRAPASTSRWTSRSR